MFQNSVTFLKHSDKTTPVPSPLDESATYLPVLSHSPWAQISREQSSPSLPPSKMSLLLSQGNLPSSCERPQNGVKTVGTSDSAHLGLNLNASTTWLWVPAQETQFCQDSVFSSVNLAVIDNFSAMFLGLLMCYLWMHFPHDLAIL